MPLDPTYPTDRLNYILADCQPKALLLGQEKVEVKRAVPTIELKDEHTFVGNYDNLELVNKPSDLVYLIYTSGTTGKPKGVMIEHRNVLNLVEWQRINGNYEATTTVLQNFNYIFDGSVWEIFPALLSGCTLEIISGEGRYDLKKLLKLFPGKQITMTPSMFKMLIDYAEEQKLLDKFNGFKRLYMAGEALPYDLVKKYQKIPGNNIINVFNAYGPTEGTVCATIYKFDQNHDKTLIGKPIGNTKVYIMNGDMLCGIGVPGELCISGDGLARGYLNCPDLTAEKFVDNPYEEGKLYRTGDLARWLPDGNIEYLGRIDEQVKIRGFRIELEEIESNIRKIENITDAVVIVREDENGEKAIYAFFTAKNQLDIGGVQDSLRESLPEYMIPSHMKQIGKMPITSNGKLDKKALPNIETKSGAKYIGPRDESEENVCFVFKEILGIDSVMGIDDNFFVLGGDSIKAIRIVSKLRERGYQTDVRNIMENRTPRKIGETIEKIEGISIDQGEVVGEVALTPIQKDFILNDDEQMHHFNQSMMLESDIKVDQNILSKVLNELVRHHDMLRATYEGRKQVIKAYKENESFDLYVYDYGGIVDEKQLKEAIEMTSNKIQTSMNLETGPLFKVGLFQTQIKDYIFLCIHHLVVDGVSWRILVEDFTTGYQLVEDGKPVSLAQKISSFQAWSGSLEHYRESNQLKRELYYWEEIEQYVESGNIASDGSRGAVEIGLLNIALSEEQTSQFLYQAPQAYHAELNDLLLTAVVRGIAQVTGQKTVSINMEGHGREDISEDLVTDRTVGWFTSMYPVVIRDFSVNIEHDLCNVKETLRRIPNKGIGYGILKSLGEQVLKGIIPTVTFNYLGEFVSNEENERFITSQFLNKNDVSEGNTFGTDVSINSVITEGMLNMMISYDASKYSTILMSDLHQEIIRQLNDVLAHCLDIEKPQYTASDFQEMKWLYDGSI